MEPSDQLDPDALAAYRSLAFTLAAKNDRPAAILAFEAYLALAPHDADALANLAYLLKDERRFAEARALVERALACHPQHAEALIVDGLLHQEVGNLPAAIAAFHQAVATSPTHHAALVYLAAALLLHNRFAEALAAFAEARSHHPNSALIRYNQGLAQLTTGDFAAGWENYEQRAIFGAGWANNIFPAPLWQGDYSLEGRTLLIYSEQGYGDTLQFCRYALLARDAGADVILAVQPPLCGLLGASITDVRVMPIGTTVPPFDLYCPLLSLPRGFRTRLDTIPTPIPYLHAPTARIAEWQIELGRGPNIGFAWSGNPQHHRHQFRTAPPELFATLFATHHGRFFSLQKDARPGEAAALASCPNVVDLGGRLSDFTETAAIVTALDLVITVDTAIAHLAGALGKRVWILLPFAADWRWLADRTDSPWYPTVRLFRQPAPGAWAPVFAEVRRALAEFASPSDHPTSIGEQ
ncbi:MAG: tetratricopeptide repeat protein [Candidatus Didemnitutus sp.]|nr:tetratricopeptide repeat protein [Candidatus Didemnitutus sp.]